MQNLAAVLPKLLPAAISWVEAQEAEALMGGRALSDVEMQLALAVGVRRPDRVRIKVVNQLPQPDQPELLAIGRQNRIARTEYCRHHVRACHLYPP